MKIFVYLIVSIGLALVAACGSAATPVELNVDNPLLSTPMPTNTTNPSTVPPTSDQSSSPSAPPASDQSFSTVSPGSNQSSSTEQMMIDLSRQNLSQRLKISIDQIVVVSTKKVIWRDASLGCPKPGIDYIRVETPGYSIMLDAGKKTYSYHTDESKRVILCNTQ